MRHVSRLSEGVTGSIYDIRTGWLCVSIARKVCVEKVGQEEIQVNVATYHIRRVRVLSMCVCYRCACARAFHLPLISAKVVFVPRSLIVTRGRHVRFASKYGSSRRKSTYL